MALAELGYRVEDRLLLLLGAGARLGTDPLVLVDDRHQALPGRRTVDHGHGLEHHPALDQLGLEIVAIGKVQRLARLGRQGQLAAAQELDQGHAAVLRLWVGLVHTGSVDYSITSYANDM